mgnify:CR=1 FL=1
MDWISGESVGLGCPHLADVFVRCEATEGLESAREVVGCHEVRRMGAQLVVVIVVKTLDRRVFDRAVHALHLTVDPWMVWLDEAMLDAVGLADRSKRIGLEYAVLRSLYRNSDGVRGRGASVTKLYHKATFHSKEHINPWDQTPYVSLPCYEWPIAGLGWDRQWGWIQG